ncbi:MAG TPA: flagellar biosynthesis protein FlhF [Firmicutes bacterium]|jgi:flagellar biosynthesis protein FlhF|nr:flagellar biosynthesis protein FlhF [Bacillota bacterium]
MRVKRFVADTAQQAIARVKRDLGDDALILHSRPFKEGGFLGLFAKKRYEVLAAIDNKETMRMPAREKSPTVKGDEKQRQLFQPEQGVILPELEKVKKELSEIRMAIAGVSEQVRTTPPPAASQQEPQAAATTATPPKRELQEVLIQTYPIRLRNRPTIVALVGPTGVGKTTTIAKLAANFALFEGKSVGLITIDTYRIAAVEQLKTYSEIINLPIEVVYTAADFKRALQNLSDKQLILIDTAGRSQKNKQQIRELRHFFNGRPLNETHLVLSANTKLEDLLETADSFKELNVNRLIFTKLDETNSLSNVVEVAEKLRIPLSYVTTGQSVPEDIEVATFEVIKRYAGKEIVNA